MMRWLPILVLLVPLAAQAAVYRWVDESGHVHYSDQPHQGAETVKLPAITTYEPQPDETGSGTTATPAGQTAQQPGLKIIAPKPAENIWSTAGVVNLSFDLEGGLARGQHIAILLDGTGNPLLSPSLNFRFNNLDRGSHTISAWVVDADGNKVGATRSVTFYLHRTAKPAKSPTPDAEHPYAPPTPEQQQQTLVPPTPEEQQKTLVPPTQEEQQKQYVPPTQQQQQQQYAPPPGFTPQ